jgi:inosine-uridine nucleoside N-ribohydrolase
MRQAALSPAPETIQSAAKNYAVLLDTDIGDDIDDALALALILSSPEISLKGVTTVFGETKLRARLAAYLLHLYGCDDIPVAAGMGTPLQPRRRPSGVPQAALLDDRVVLPALRTLSGPELIVQTALVHPGQLILLCIGPLTNVAHALLLEPRIHTTIRRIVMMGGTSGFPFPEWNVRSDAKAAQIALGSGIPITMLGYNVTTRCQLREWDLEQLQSIGSPQTQFLSKLIAVWQRHRPRWHSQLPYLHDLLTVAALCRPELFTFKKMTARVLTGGPFKGYMVPRSMSGPLVYAAVDVAVAEVREWIMQRLLLPSMHAQTP